MAQVRLNREEDCALDSVEQLLRTGGASEDHIRSLPDEALNAKLRIFCKAPKHRRSCSNRTSRQIWWLRSIRTKRTRSSTS